MVIVINNLPANAGDIDRQRFIPLVGNILPGGGNGNPLQYSCLEDPMDIGSWQAIVHRVVKSWTQLK